MGIDVRWSVENQIILTTGYDEVTVDDLARGMQTANDLMRGLDGHIHDVLDFRAVTKHPLLPALLQFRAFFANPQLGWLIILSNDKIVTFFSTLIAGINNNRIRTLATPEEAAAFLSDRDEALPRSLTLHAVDRAELR